MAHRDAVVDGDGVEPTGDATGFTHGVRDDVADVLEVDVPWNELGVRVRDRDDRLIEIAVGHTGCTPQRASACGVAPLGGDG